MERVQIDLPCGRSVLVEPKVAARARKIEDKNRTLNRQIERELKQERLGPSNPGNQFAGWQGTNEVNHPLPNGLQVKSSEDKFQEFMALNRAEVIASKQTF